MLAARPGMGRAAEHPRQRVDDGIERGDDGYAERVATDLEAVAQLGLGERIDDETRPLADLAQHALQMAFRTHHRPEMLDRLDTLEPREAGLGDHVERLAGGIGQEMEMMSH
jgi:hypothetical protein